MVAYLETIGCDFGLASAIHLSIIVVQVSILSQSWRDCWRILCRRLCSRTVLCTWMQDVVDTLCKTIGTIIQFPLEVIWQKYALRFFVVKNQVYYRLK